MMYYTVNSDTGLVMESNDVCPDPQEQADYFRAPVYIIKGEHSGLTASPAPLKKPEPAIAERELADLKKLQAWTGEQSS